MRPSHSLTVISLGGGVQSSVMALMASGGALGPMPDCAIFADTHWEPPTIYTHLEWLAGNLAFPPAHRGQRAQPPRRTPGPSPTTQATATSLTFPFI